MAIWNTLKGELDKAGRAAQSALDEGKLRLEQHRAKQRAEAAAVQTGMDRIAVVGGVAANSELRASLPGAALAPLELCTDNAAMIASAARYVEEIPFARYLGLDAYASTAA